jgi:plastocyanin
VAGLLPILLLLGMLPSASVVSSEPARAASATPAGASAPGTGTITGKVSYKSDPARPWRLGRYYIKNARSGELAEAVVAIAQKGLKGPETARTPETAVVDQKDFQFSPETVAIRAGDRVKFLNNDNQIHNVQTLHTHHSFNVNMPTASQHVETFAVAGGIHRPYRITCGYHGAMRSWVFVFEHPWYQVTGKDGRFQLRNVPPGEYRLEVNHPAGELKAARTIRVKSEETVVVEFPLGPNDRVEDAR